MDTLFDDNIGELLAFLEKSFIYYCAFGKLDEAIKYIENGGKVDYIDDDKNGFIVACYKGKTQLVNELLRYKCIRNLINIKTNLYTPLLCACEKGYNDIFDILIANGADPNLSDNYGDSPLMIACYYNQIDIIDRLLYMDININQRNLYGQTALFYCKSTDVMHRLYIHGLNFNITDNLGNTALNYYCQNNNSNVEMVMLFVNYGIDINVENNKGMKALSNANIKNLTNIST